MGNESSKKAGHQHQKDCAGSSTSTAAERIQNAIKPGPSSAAVHRQLEQARKSKTLNLKSTGMKNVPPSIEELANELRTVDLSCNKLHTLPLYIDQFTMLRQLYISENRLTVLPDDLGCLRRLEVLDVVGNQLQTIPDSLIGCSALSTINLANNKLTNFPIVLTHLLRLELLNLAGNLINALPDEISGLKATELNMQRNQLASLNPSYLAKCERLKTLRTDENCLTKEEFTKELLEYSQLSLITFEGNLFQEKDFQALPGYDRYEQRFTATKRRLF